MIPLVFPAAIVFPVVIGGNPSTSPPTPPSNILVEEQDANMAISTESLSNLETEA